MSNDERSESRPEPVYRCLVCDMTFQLQRGYEGAKVACPRCGTPPETPAAARTVTR